MYKVVNEMVDTKIIHYEEIDIYRYGMECMILYAVHCISYFLIALLLNKQFEILVIALTFVPLRKAAGGYHAKTRFGCYLFSCSMVFITLLFQEIVYSNNIYLFVWIISNLLLIGLAPIDNVNKVFEADECRYFKRKTRISLLFFDLALIFLMVLKYQDLMKLIILGLMMSAVLVILGKIVYKSRLV